LTEERPNGRAVGVAVLTQVEALTTLAAQDAYALIVIDTLARSMLGGDETTITCQPRRRARMVMRPAYGTR
jgi:hypothetical protein